MSLKRMYKFENKQKIPNKEARDKNVALTRAIGSKKEENFKRKVAKDKSKKIQKTYL